MLLCKGDRHVQNEVEARTISNSLQQVLNSNTFVQETEQETSRLPATGASLNASKRMSCRCNKVDIRVHHSEQAMPSSV